MSWDERRKLPSSSCVITVGDFSQTVRARDTRDLSIPTEAGRAARKVRKGQTFPMALRQIRSYLWARAHGRGPSGASWVERL